MSDKSAALETLSEISDVSRETVGRLEHLVHLLEKWNSKVNLVSRSTIDTVWTRHILDSAQLFRHAPKSWKLWGDLGSGAGFPGLVIGILSMVQNPDGEVVLIDSDTRKCEFQRNVIRELSLPAKVVDNRIEATEPLGAQVLTARALAPLDQLLSLAERHSGPGAVCLFPKGRTANAELTEARRSWRLTVKQHESLTDIESTILEIGDFARV